MPALVPSLTAPRSLAMVAVAGACVGLALGGALAVGGGGRAAPTAAIRQAFASTAPELRPRATPSFDWALLLPRPPLRLASTGRDLECLTDAVYYEARGEPAAGQEAVAQVVLNRARKPGFPKSVCGVVFQRAGRACQFSFVCDGSITSRRESSAWTRARKIAARALGGYQLAAIGGATHFHVAGLQAGWGGGLLQVARIGAHVFYDFGRPHTARRTTDPVLAPAVLRLPISQAMPPAPSTSAAPTA